MLYGGLALALANRPRSGYAFPTAHNLKRCSRQATRYATYIRSCEILCARTSNLPNSSYVRVNSLPPTCPVLFFLAWNSHVVRRKPHSVQSTTARSESVGPRRSRSHPHRAGARTLLNSTPPLRG